MSFEYKDKCTINKKSQGYFYLYRDEDQNEIYSLYKCEFECKDCDEEYDNLDELINHCNKFKHDPVDFYCMTSSC